MSEITPERSGYCMLQLGLPTLIETRTLSECAALCRKLGLDFIELNMNLPQYQLNVLDIPLMKNIAARYGVFYTIHLDENLNVSDFNPYIADAYRRTVSETIRLAMVCVLKKANVSIPSPAIKAQRRGISSIDRPATNRIKE